MLSVYKGASIPENFTPLVMFDMDLGMTGFSTTKFVDSINTILHSSDIPFRFSSFTFEVLDSSTGTNRAIGILREAVHNGYDLHLFKVPFLSALYETSPTFKASLEFDARETFVAKFKGLVTITSRFVTKTVYRLSLRREFDTTALQTKLLEYLMDKTTAFNAAAEPSNLEVTIDNYEILNNKISQVTLVVEKGNKNILGASIVLDSGKYCEYIGSPDSVCCERATKALKLETTATTTDTTTTTDPVLDVVDTTASAARCTGTTLGSNSCTLQNTCLPAADYFFGVDADCGKLGNQQECEANGNCIYTSGQKTVCTCFEYLDDQEFFCAPGQLFCSYVEDRKCVSTVAKRCMEATTCGAGIATGCAEAAVCSEVPECDAATPCCNQIESTCHPDYITIAGGKCVWNTSTLVCEKQAYDCTAFKDQLDTTTGILHVKDFGALTTIEDTEKQASCFTEKICADVLSALDSVDGFDPFAICGAGKLGLCPEPVTSCSVCMNFIRSLQFKDVGTCTFPGYDPAGVDTFKAVLMRENERLCHENLHSVYQVFTECANISW